MAISNHTIVAIGILTRSAKKQLGTFKVSDIINNSKLAFELLTKAILSNNHELVSLAVELNKSLKIETNLINALAAYVSHIQSKNLNDTFIQKRLDCLNSFIKHLEGVELDSAAYRQAANDYLKEVDAKDVTFCLSLIRNFHPYWAIKDDKFLESKEQKPFDFRPKSKNLIPIWNSLDHTFLTTLEESMLSVYVKAVKEIKVTGEELELRVKITKLIIIKQRNYEKTANGYRQNIDYLKHYFSNDHLLEYFLSVAREFYSLWIDLQMSSSRKNQ